MPKRIDLTGRRFGMLEVVRLSDRQDDEGRLLWECKCDCGETVYLRGYALLHGHYKSCRCARDNKRDAGALRHIEADTVDGTRISALKAKIHADNKSGHKGVIWLESRGKWRAYIGVKGKQITLGYYVRIEDAIAARQAAEDKYHKPYLAWVEEDNNGDQI